MADKQISQLVAASTINDEDLLVMQQGNVAKKVSGELLSDFVYDAAMAAIKSNAETTLTPQTRTINGKALSSDVSLTAEDIPYDEDAASHTSGSTGEAVSELKNALSTLYLTDAIGPMLSVAESYFDVAYAQGTNLVYQQRHHTGIMAYNPFYVYDGEEYGNNPAYDGKPCTHCAQFVMTLLKGIRYKNCRYISGIQGKNKISQWAWSPDHLFNIQYGGTQWADYSQGPSNTYTDGYMDLKAIADYAQSHGLLRSMDEYDINVAPGDLIFEGPDESVEDISYLHHVSFAIQVGMESKTVQVLEAWNAVKPDGSGVGIRSRNIPFEDIKYYTRLPIKSSNYTSRIVYDSNKEVSIDSQHASSATVYRLTNLEWEPGFYTFILQADVTDGNLPYVLHKLPNSRFTPHVPFVCSAGVYITTAYISSELVNNDVQINVRSGVGIDTYRLVVIKGYINSDTDLIARINYGLGV